MIFRWKPKFLRYGEMPDDPGAPPCIWLMRDNWNDFGYECSFDAYYYDETGVNIPLGRTKIANASSAITSLPTEFTSLDDGYCSLWQNIEHYDTLVRVFGLAQAVSLCAALRDIGSVPEWADTFTDQDVIRNSLRRESEAARAEVECGKYFGRGITLGQNGFAFTFTCRLDGFDADHVLPFDFLTTSDLPHRIVALVGKNGTGKSGVLAKLAAAMSGLQRSAGVFLPDRPKFRRVVVLSYSIFQAFKPHTFSPAVIDFVGFSIPVPKKMPNRRKAR